MGFALLAELPAYYGLYASFYCVVIYFFLGTSRHIGMGTTALVSIMISAVVQRQLLAAGLSDDDVTNDVTNGTAARDDVVRFKVGVIMSVSLIAGIIQVETVKSFFQMLLK